MDYSKATDEQIKVIFDWEDGVSSRLLKGLYEEALNRRLFDSKILFWINNYFGSSHRAEQQTKLDIEDLLWIGYELGYEHIDRYKPIKPFARYWYTAFNSQMGTLIRRTNAQKRTADICPLDEAIEWTVPDSHNTELTAINRVYIESIMSQLRDTEKEIVMRRYEGYTYPEIAKMQGVSKGEMRKRVMLYQKRIKGA